MVRFKANWVVCKAGMTVGVNLHLHNVALQRIKEGEKFF